MAQSLFNALPAGARENVFKADFSKAEKSCPQKIQIGRVLKRTCEDFG
jgi:predicted aldo/keto reductase-like oxidoreductase